MTAVTGHKASHTYLPIQAQYQHTFFAKHSVLQNFYLETQHSWKSEIHPSSFLNVLKMLGDAVSLLGNITLFHVPQKIQICPMTMDEIECK